MSEMERKNLQLDDDGMSNKLTMVTRSRKKKIKEFNDTIICSICNGYLIEATTISDCLHACKYSNFSNIFFELIDLFMPINTKLSFCYIL